MPLIPIKGRLKNLSDDELLVLFLKDKNMVVLGELYGRYINLVYGVCLKYFSEKEDAKDAVMQIFERVNEEVFKHKITNFKGWLYVVTKNFCLMEIRKNKNFRKIQTEENSSVFMEIGIETHPIDKEQDLNLETALLECIKKLKLEQKQCIQQFYFENRCYREIAKDLNLEEKKVKSFIQNGKRNLKICLEKQK